MDHEFSRIVEGILFVYNRCGHCGQVPNDLQIQDLLKKIQKQYGDPCSVCGERAKVTKATIRHYKEGDVDSWGGEVVSMSEIAEISGYVNGRYVKIRIHKDCAKTALPYANIEPGDHKFCGKCGTPFSTGEQMTWGTVPNEHPLCEACVQKNGKDSTC